MVLPGMAYLLGPVIPGLLQPVEVSPQEGHSFLLYRGKQGHDLHGHLLDQWQDQSPCAVLTMPPVDQG